MTDSNRRQLLCKSRALPTELITQQMGGTSTAHVLNILYIAVYVNNYFVLPFHGFQGFFPQLLAVFQANGATIDLLGACDDVVLISQCIQVVLVPEPGS